jgi:hypothetical protein
MSAIFNHKNTEKQFSFNFFRLKTFYFCLIQHPISHLYCILNRSIILAAPAVGLLLSGATRLPMNISIYPQKMAAARELPAATPKMWTETGTLYKGESFDLSFETPHAPYLGVIDPSGKFFYVIFPASESIGKIKPLVDGEKFRGRKNIKIHTASLRADPYINGVMENKPVFTKSGVYRFVMGDNLHTDDPSSLQTVKITYWHTARPAKIEVAR